MHSKSELQEAALTLNCHIFTHPCMQAFKAHFSHEQHQQQGNQLLVLLAVNHVIATHASNVQAVSILTLSYCIYFGSKTSSIVHMHITNVLSACRAVLLCIFAPSDMHSSMPSTPTPTYAPV